MEDIVAHSSVEGSTFYRSMYFKGVGSCERVVGPAYAAGTSRSRRVAGGGSELRAGGCALVITSYSSSRCAVRPGAIPGSSETEKVPIKAVRSNRRD